MSCLSFGGHIFPRGDLHFFVFLNWIKSIRRHRKLYHPFCGVCSRNDLIRTLSVGMK